MSGGYPFGYHLTKLRGDDGTPFADPAEQERVWGREWGAADEVGRLRMVLVRRPARRVRRPCGPTAGTSDAQALVDPDGALVLGVKDAARPGAGATRSTPALVAALEAEGVEVVRWTATCPRTSRRRSTRATR